MSRGQNQTSLSVDRNITYRRLYKQISDKLEIPVRPLTGFVIAQLDGRDGQPVRDLPANDARVNLQSAGGGIYLGIRPTDSEYESPTRVVSQYSPSGSPPPMGPGQQRNTDKWARANAPPKLAAGLTAPVSQPARKLPGRQLAPHEKPGGRYSKVVSHRPITEVKRIYCGVGSDVSMIEVPIDPKQKVKRAPHPARTHGNPRGASASSLKAGPHTPTVKDRYDKKARAQKILEELAPPEAEVEAKKPLFTVRDSWFTGPPPAQHTDVTPKKLKKQAPAAAPEAQEERAWFRGKAQDPQESENSVVQMSSPVRDDDEPDEEEAETEAEAEEAEAEEAPQEPSIEAAPAASPRSWQSENTPEKRAEARAWFRGQAPAASPASSGDPAPSEQPAEPLRAADAAPAPSQATAKPTESPDAGRRMMHQLMMEAYTTADPDNNEFVPKNALIAEVKKCVAGHPEVEQLLHLLTGVTSVVLDRDEFDELVIDWLKGKLGAKPGTATPVVGSEGQPDITPAETGSEGGSSTTSADTGSKEGSSTTPMMIETVTMTSDNNTEDGSSAVDVMLEAFGVCDEADTGFVPRNMLVGAIRDLVSKYPEAEEVLARLGAHTDLVLEYDDFEALVRELVED